MNKITLDQAREALTAAVATQGPDFVYNPGGNGSCFYRPLTVGEQPTGIYPPVVEGDPRTKTGCLIGVALDILGVEYDHNARTDVYTVLGYGQQEKATNAAKSYFAVAQRRQDDGRTWGQALEAAEGVADRFIEQHGDSA